MDAVVADVLPLAVGIALSPFPIIPAMLLLFPRRAPVAEQGRGEGRSAWMRSIEDSPPAKARRLGVLLSAANPKIVLLAGAVGLSIGSAELSTAVWRW